jgi:hypothetical protein
MKKLLLIAVFFSMNMTFAQFYVSASAGYSMSSAGILTGTSLNADQTEATNHYGSFGKGANFQLTGGYFFNETFGAELGFGYLLGADVNTSSYETNDAGNVSEYTNSTAHARAVGLTASLVYNFSKNFYGKFGIATKLGGKTEAEFEKNTETPLSIYGVEPIVAEGVNDYHGRLPLGFVAVFGYRYQLSGNWNLYAELEYLGINVKRNTSEFAELTVTTPAIPAGIVGPNAVPEMTWSLGEPALNHPVFGTIYSPSEIEYVDSLPVPNDDPAKQLSSVAPYSSFGLNIGITYTFSKKE